MRRIQRHGHHQPRQQSRTGQRQNPPAEDESNLPPVHSPDVEIHQPHADRCSSETLRRADGQAHTTGQKHRDGGAQFRAEASTGTHLRDAVAERTDDLEAEEPESRAEEETGDDEHPDGGGDLGGHFVGLPRAVGGGPGADGVGDVVGSVRDGHEHCGEDLAVGEEVLGPVVVNFAAGVRGLEAGIFVGDAVAGHALEEEVFEESVEAGWVDGGEVFGWGEESLFRGDDTVACRGDDERVGFFERGGDGDVFL